MHRHTALLCLGAVLLAACGRQGTSRRADAAPGASNLPAAAAPSRPSRGTPSEPVAVQMRRVNLHVDAGAVLEIRQLRGSLVSTRPGRPPIFDDQTSYAISIDRAEIALTDESLTRLLNGIVFAAATSPLKDVRVVIDGQRMKQKGTLRKGVSVPFSTEVEPSVAPDGRIRLHPRSMTAAGVPAKGILDLFGIELDDLVKLRDTHGVTVEDDDFLVDPSRLLPSIAMRGRLTAVRLEPHRLVQVFNTRESPPLAPPVPRTNYMYYRGGTLAFGKLTMSDADMELVDHDSNDVFDFSPREYVKQLVAGYSKNTPSGGLKVYMPDYDDLMAGRSGDLRPTVKRSRPNASRVNASKVKS